MRQLYTDAIHADRFDWACQVETLALREYRYCELAQG